MTFDEDLICKYVPLDKQEEALQKLHDGYPVQYIIGDVDFCGNIIKVNEDVLIPRYETEYLVEHLLFYLNKYEYQKPKILEVGTGSGCISIALKKRILDAEIDAIDISDKAINVAKENATNNDVQINFINKSIEEYLPKSKYNVLVSNPPYVSFAEEVDPKIKYEPRIAIYAKEKGLYFYKVILEKSLKILNKKNIIAFEIGKDQASYITSLANEIYPNAKVICLKDLNEFDRYIFIINE